MNLQIVIILLIVILLILLILNNKKEVSKSKEESLKASFEMQNSKIIKKVKKTNTTNSKQKHGKIFEKLSSGYDFFAKDKEKMRQEEDILKTNSKTQRLPRSTISYNLKNKLKIRKVEE